jgi:hypothetical protein
VNGSSSRAAKTGPVPSFTRAASREASEAARLRRRPLA